jgi:hypothetical protein
MLPQRHRPTVRRMMTKLWTRKDTERQETLNLAPIFKIVPIKDSEKMGNMFNCNIDADCHVVQWFNNVYDYVLVIS